MKWYVQVLKNYANFSGRARRAELWWYILINLLIAFLLAFIEALLFNHEYSVLLLIYELAVIIPSLAVETRRLHDVGKSGLWLLISLIPFAGIYLFYLFVKAGDPGTNQYGVSPLESQPYADYIPANQNYIPDSGKTNVSQVKYCRKCGARLISADSQFCSECGAKVIYEESRNNY